MNKKPDFARRKNQITMTITDADLAVINKMSKGLHTPKATVLYDYFRAGMNNFVLKPLTYEQATAYEDSYNRFYQQVQQLNNKLSSVANNLNQFQHSVNCAKTVTDADYDNIISQAKKITTTMQSDLSNIKKGLFDQWQRVM